MYGPVQLIACTLVGNTSNLGMGGAARLATLVDCVVWGNLGTGLVPTSDNLADATANYSLVEGGWPGVGNIDADSLFWDEAGGNFQLFVGSPAIDAADPNSPLGPDGTRADMGAFAFDADHCGAGCDGALGSRYCVATSNSTGQAASISALGTLDLPSQPSAASGRLPARGRGRLLPYVPEPNLRAHAGRRSRQPLLGRTYRAAQRSGASQQSGWQRDQAVGSHGPPAEHDPPGVVGLGQGADPGRGCLGPLLQGSSGYARSSGVRRPCRLPRKSHGLERVRRQLPRHRGCTGWVSLSEAIWWTGLKPFRASRASRGFN